MKILFAGGGTGGHFYPIVAVVQVLKKIAREEKFVDLDLIFMSDSPYDQNLLEREGIRFKRVSSGKMRRYVSFWNILDSFRTFKGVIEAFFKVYLEFPDVVFGKGGYGSFPPLLAARILRIPVIIHESDAVPGAVNRWAGRFAKRVAVSFAEAAEFFPKGKTAVTGNPIRKSILGKIPEEGREVFKLEPKVPVLLILGGSQGASKLNEAVLAMANELMSFCQIIHQCGKNNLEEISSRLSVILADSSFKSRYHLFGFLNSDELRAASGAADLVVSRAGASAVFEIAAWGLASIIVPLKNSAQNHQEKNALSYLKSGAAVVIEEPNLSPHILYSEIKRLISNPEEIKKMEQAALNFSKPEAAEKIAREIINLGLEHA